MGRLKLYKHCTVKGCTKPNGSGGLCMKHRRELVGEWPSAKKCSQYYKNQRYIRGEESMKKSQRENSRKYNTTIKFEVLSHYSPDGFLRCSVFQCPTFDIDMLTLDHVDNDGAQDRKYGRGYAGVALYGLLKRQGFPLGFQTLCCNHQNKKELERRRSKTQETHD